ncbi:hypothetical protein [Streptomyces niveus]|uniref:hypothetical protein n=1 Tax=Streptomyces niveus TaxID=193462 RepID=UPI00114C9061|nr:hypothetical protein [Streptomyces niveus]
MNVREGTAHLEWWANPATCLARLPVRVTSTPDGAAFCSLHFDDSSAVSVEAAQSGDVNYLWLRVVLAPDSGAEFDRSGAVLEAVA